MSIVRIQPRIPQYPPEIVQAIVDELQRNQPDGSDDLPQITEEEVANSRSVFVTVVWDGWQHLSKEGRGRAIMEAYKQVRPDDVPYISLVIGLTHSEVRKLEGVPRFS